VLEQEKPGVAVQAVALALRLLLLDVALLPDVTGVLPPGLEGCERVK
jgi:hypothetical protein